MINNSQNSKYSEFDVLDLPYEYYRGIISCFVSNLLLQGMLLTLNIYIIYLSIILPLQYHSFVISFLCFPCFMFIHTYFYYYEMSAFVFTKLNISEDYKMSLEGYKWFKRFTYDIDLKDYYFKTIIIVTPRSGSPMILRLTNKFTNQIISISSSDISRDLVRQLFDLLISQYPENNNGKKWKFLIIGNTW